MRSDRLKRRSLCVSFGYFSLHKQRKVTGCRATPDNLLALTLTPNPKPQKKPHLIKQGFPQIKNYLLNDIQKLRLNRRTLQAIKHNINITSNSQQKRRLHTIGISKQTLQQWHNSTAHNSQTQNTRTLTRMLTQTR